MLKRSNLNYKFRNRDAQWRNFQYGLRKQSARRRALRRFPAYLLLLCILILLTHGLFRLLDRKHISIYNTASPISEDQQITPVTLEHRDIIQRLMVVNSTTKKFGITTGDLDYEITTSLMPALQEYIIDRIDRKNSLYFGFVIMEPDTGRILSMVSHDRLDPENNVCANADFPAASIFKIVTAAAAIETKNYQPHTPMTFNGNQYTLYKNQLTRTRNRYSSTISFANAFAKSINPVFGNIGMHDLGKTDLEAYGEAFGFNLSPQFEICMDPSRLIIKDEPYNWAEIASGFNRTTMLSPVHGALIIGVILNDGRWVDPRLIDAIRSGNDMVYRGHPNNERRVIQPQTAASLKKMLEATVKSGTAAKTFRGVSRDKILSRLTIGGKTGSINDRPDYSIRYDWFTGFAEKKDGSQKIAVSVIVAHKDFIGTRAAQYARMGIKKYYEIKKHESESASSDKT
jgi:cell division protein FtsI/penicillin-binding protein 2